jgi:hypothetical protein
LEYLTINPSYSSKSQSGKRLDKAEAQAIALGALGWALAAPERAERLLSLTGLTPDQLRERLEDDTVLAAVLEFLAGHEPDLLAAAAALDMAPETIILAQRSLTT